MSASAAAPVSPSPTGQWSPDQRLRAKVHSKPAGTHAPQEPVSTRTVATHHTTPGEPSPHQAEHPESPPAAATPAQTHPSASHPHQSQDAAATQPQTHYDPKSRGAGSLEGVNLPCQFATPSRFLISATAATPGSAEPARAARSRCTSTRPLRRSTSVTNNDAHWRRHSVTAETRPFCR